MAEIEWEDVAAFPSDEEIGSFEEAHGVRLLDDHRWFLQNVANGGRPVENYTIPTQDCPGGAAALHCVYGINHPDRGYDLAWALTLRPQRNATYFPFASDEVGGDVLVDLVSRPGRLVYDPSDPAGLYHCVNSIRDFTEHLVLDEDGS